jgi:argininosuccinate lyase
MTQSRTGPQLWAKDQALDDEVHAFTVGADPDLDLRLLPFDCVASAAHAQMLARIGILSEQDAGALTAALAELYASAMRRELVIERALEDGHTLLEHKLSQRLPHAGALIHTGRSRNDQVAVAQGLYLRSQALQVMAQLRDLSTALIAQARQYAGLAWPGYSHLQRAMPSSAGQWLASMAEALLEELRAGFAVLSRLDHCPLGAGAGFGVPLPTERGFLARRLGYTRIHISPIDALSGRVRHAQVALDWYASIAAGLERWAYDLSLYTTAEFGFVQLAEAHTTGSSIMPQKRNPDVVELLRANARKLRGLAGTHAVMASGLPSGYHRDWQLCKAQVIEASELLQSCLRIFSRILLALAFNKARARSALSADLYATEAAYALVQGGMNFRAAYKKIGSEVLSGHFEKPSKRLLGASLGSPRRLGLSVLSARSRTLSQRLERVRAHHDHIMQSIWTMP